MVGSLLTRRNNFCAPSEGHMPSSTKVFTQITQRSDVTCLSHLLPSRPFHGLFCSNCI